MIESKDLRVSVHACTHARTHACLHGVIRWQRRGGMAGLTGRLLIYLLIPAGVSRLNMSLPTTFSVYATRNRLTEKHFRNIKRRSLLQKMKSRKYTCTCIWISSAHKHKMHAAYPETLTKHTRLTLPSFAYKILFLLDLLTTSEIASQW